MVFILFQRYEFESKSQPLLHHGYNCPWCLSYFKDTNLKANHNRYYSSNLLSDGVYPISKIRIWKQITTKLRADQIIMRCLSYFKDTNLKANHNRWTYVVCGGLGVYPISKIRIWKQITTVLALLFAQVPVFILFQRYEFESKSQLSHYVLKLIYWCLSYFKDTNLKANHNKTGSMILFIDGVYPISKIRIWKQITTNGSTLLSITRCLSYFKDTNLKANHNRPLILLLLLNGVYPISKIRIWKQITTNNFTVIFWMEVFILFQRYEFESKSQQFCKSFIPSLWCLSYFKDTNLKANHNSRHLH